MAQIIDMTEFQEHLDINDMCDDCETVLVGTLPTSFVRIFGGMDCPKCGSFIPLEIIEDYSSPFSQED